MAHSFFSSLRLVHGRACGGLFHSRATDTDETSVLACSRGRENGWWLREHFSLTNSPSRRRVQSVFGQLKSVYTVTVHLTLGGQSSDTSLPNLPGPFWSFAFQSGTSDQDSCGASDTVLGSDPAPWINTGAVPRILSRVLVRRLGFCLVFWSGALD